MTSFRLVMHSRDAASKMRPIVNCDRIASRLHQAAMKVGHGVLRALRTAADELTLRNEQRKRAPHGPLATEARVERLHHLGSDRRRQIVSGGPSSDRGC